MSLKAYLCLLVVVLIAVSPVFVSCASQTLRPWSDVDIGYMPWCAPEERAIFQERTPIQFALFLPHPEVLVRWKICGNLTLDPESLAERCFDYFDEKASHEVLRRLIVPQGVNAPTPFWNLTIVSTNPIIVVITFSGPRAGEGAYYLTPEYMPFTSMHEMYQHAVVDMVRDRQIHYGSRIASLDQIAWFSPDLDIPPRAAESVGEDRWVIKFSGGLLRLFKNEGMDYLDVVREEAE